MNKQKNVVSKQTIRRRFPCSLLFFMVNHLESIKYEKEKNVTKTKIDRHKRMGRAWLRDVRHGKCVAGGVRLFYCFVAGLVEALWGKTFEWHQQQLDMAIFLVNEELFLWDFWIGQFIKISLNYISHWQLICRLMKYYNSQWHFNVNCVIQPAHGLK